MDAEQQWFIRLNDKFDRILEALGDLKGQLGAANKQIEEINRKQDKLSDRVTQLELSNASACAEKKGSEAAFTTLEKVLATMATLMALYGAYKGWVH